MTPAGALPWVLVFMVPVAVFLIVAVDAALEWNDRRRFGDECTAYHRCPECRAEPPSRLDRADRPWTRGVLPTPGRPVEPPPTTEASSAAPVGSAGTTTDTRTSIYARTR